MRATCALITLVAALPLAAQRPETPAFLRAARESSEPAAATYSGVTYRPIRSGELQSAGFLTELHAMPFGLLLGPVDPQLVHSSETAEVAFPGTTIAVQPPEGATYQRGDTVVLAMVVPGPRGWGDIVIPTGLARIGDRSPRQTIATVITMFGAIRGGSQVVLPLEPIVNPGDVQPVAIAGPSGEVITSREPRDVSQVGEILFINVGRTAGMRVGDFVELRRHAGPRLNGADTIADVMAVAQVVHVGEKSSTIRLTRVIDPNVRAGTPVVRVATLPS